MSKQIKLTEEQSKLVEKNIGLAYTSADKFTKLNQGKMVVRQIDRDDMVQIGLEELCKSAVKFKEEKGFEFSTFAMTNMNYMMLRELDKFNQVKLPYPHQWNGKIWKDRHEELATVYDGGVGSLDVVVSAMDGGDMELSNIIHDNTNHYNDSDMIEMFKNILTELEYKTISLLYKDYTRLEICGLLNRTTNQTYRAGKSGREKIRKAMSDMEKCAC